MKKILVTMIVISGMAISDLCTAADEPDIVIHGDVHQLCVAKQGGVCNQYLDLTNNQYHIHKHNIQIHGDVAQLCSAKTGGQCNIDGRNYGSNSCIKYQDGHLWCFNPT